MDIRELSHTAIFVPDSQLTKMFMDLSRGLMKAQLPDKPELWEKLTPKYPIGCKRGISSDDFLPVFNQEHILLETRPISKITDKGIEIDG